MIAVSTPVFPSGVNTSRIRQLILIGNLQHLEPTAESNAKNQDLTRKLM